MFRLTSLLVLCLPLTAMAAAMIESRDGQGQASRIYIEGDKARMEMLEEQGYMVLDVKNNSMKAVIPQQRTVMDMSDLLAEDGKAGTRSVNSQNKSSGPGPKIAGYQTRQYDIFADGQYCGSSFVSVQAMHDLKLEKFARALQTMSNQVQDKITDMGINAMVQPCEQAAMQLSDQLQEMGFPLRVIDKDKRLLNEVTRISRNAKLPANAFAIPADYQVTNPNRMMQDAMKQMPQMQEMMKNMPPEAMEMMRKNMEKMYQQ